MIHPLFMVMKFTKSIILPLVLLLAVFACKEEKKAAVQNVGANSEMPTQAKTKLIFDTDANNELDDQHALAYMLLSGDTFNVRGITVNATRNGEGIQGHYDEAERVMQLCNLKGATPLLKGANGNFKEIVENFDPMNYDGQEGVDFLLEETKDVQSSLVIIKKQEP